MSEQLLRSPVIKEDQAPEYRNPDLPVDRRVADLLGRMTIQEKVAQMLCVWGQKKTLLSDASGNFDLDRLRIHLKDGIGQIGRLSDTGGGQNAQEMAELANKLQEFFVEETRLGIPVIFHEECLHGLAAPDATSYPQPIGLASTFNPELIEEIYTAIAEETRSRGAHLALTPVVDVARDPRWGRVEETFGEDPYLVSQLGIAAVRGFQGDGTFRDKKRVIATLKHFAAHGQPESGSNCGPGNFSERVLRDVFLFPFKEVLDKANPASVMASYNEIDGLPSHANAWLLRDVLRKEWGFKGFVVSDYYGITELKGKEISVSHAVAKDETEAAIRAAKAGVNIELPDPDCYPLLPSLVERGEIAEALIDELVAPLLEYKFRLGLFEDPYVPTDGTSHELRMQEERALALRAAQETIVLLKNKGECFPSGRIGPGPLLSLVPMPTVGSWAVTAASPDTIPPSCRGFRSGPETMPPYSTAKGARSPWVVPGMKMLSRCRTRGRIASPLRGRFPRRSKPMSWCWSWATTNRPRVKHGATVTWGTGPVSISSVCRTLW